MLCGEKIGRNVVANSGASLCVRKPENGSGGPTIATTSGKTASSVENVRVNWSNRDLRGSTFVGDKHESNTDFGGSADKLSVCFFLPALLLGALLAARNNLLRRSLADVCSFSPRGGLPVFVCGSEFGASGSVFTFSFPELSFFHSEPLSK